ncbi:4'-phosphopantetheinyl transferase family protein [Methylomonas sp. MgM2]
MMPVAGKPFLTIADTGVWFESLQADEGEYRQYWSWLSEAERQTAQGFVRELHRRRYAVCHGKVRLLLSNYLRIAPQAIRFERQALGKPFLPDANGGPHALRFNLSHSGDWMLLAAGPRELGVDIEVWDPRHDPESLAGEILAPKELEYWQTLPPAEHTAAFYRFWTRKESLAKAVGSGIGFGVKLIETSTSGEAKCLSLPADCGFPDDWYLIDLDLGQGISGTIALATGTALESCQLNCPDNIAD